MVKANLTSSIAPNDSFIIYFGMINGQTNHKMDSHILDNDWNGKGERKTEKLKYILCSLLYIYYIVILKRIEWEQKQSWTTILKGICIPMTLQHNSFWYHNSSTVLICKTSTLNHINKNRVIHRFLDVFFLISWL